MGVSLRSSARFEARCVAFFLLVAFCPAGARSAGKNKDKKEEKEKKEKIEPWVEVRTAHFIVASDDGEKGARRVAGEFEQLLGVFQATMPNSRISTGIPVRILASRNGESYGRVFPESPFDRRGEREQPAGLYLAGPEKTFIGLRMNARGRFRYAQIFQNYAKDILKRSYRNLPAWLREGYSSVYGNLMFTDRGVGLASPDPDDLSVLTESPLLPLDLVLDPKRSSAYATSGNKDGVYFAESRVFVHFLINDPEVSGSKALDRYIADVEGGADPYQTAHTVFGDFNRLQTKLESYVTQTNRPPTEMSVSSAGDAGGPARLLTPAESEARIADFLALRGKTDDAQDKLEEALKAEPGLAEAEQSLGFIALKRNELDDAQKHFEQAAKLDAKDGLTYYGLGLVFLTRAGATGVPAGAAEAFEMSANLSPDFAPAWYNLALIYSQRDETLPKSLTSAQKAASLAPGVSGYQVELATVLTRMGRTEEARKTAVRVQETSTDRAMANKAGDLLAKMSQPPASSAPGAAPKNPQGTSGTPVLSQRKVEPEPKPAAAPSVPPNKVPTPPPAAEPPLFSEKREYSMMGTITEVNCASAPEIQITLKSQSIAMKLHAIDQARVSVKATESGPAAGVLDCSKLRGRTARISYQLTTFKPWDGEMLAVEFQIQP
jgi:Flp pilus assembly protein TadD